MTVMRIAIAGSGGVAQHIAHFLDETEHLFVILSRTVSISFSHAV
jgi:saccharopine dehydrogenase-like NADP-dependent oxidoreductase